MTFPMSFLKPKTLVTKKNYFTYSISFYLLCLKVFFFQAEKTKPYQANVKIPRFFYEKFYFDQEKINLSYYLPEVMN